MLCQQGIHGTDGTFPHTPLIWNIPSPLELLTGQKARTSLPSILWGNSTTWEHHEASHQEAVNGYSEELSIWTHEPGQTVWCFDTFDKMWKPAVILEPAPKPHSYWCRIENSNQKLRRTWLHIKPHLNTTECKEKQMLSSTQMEENHTFQFAPAVDRNESLFPTITSLPDTPSNVPDRSPTVRKSANPSTQMEPLRRATRLTKWVQISFYVYISVR